jgi:hypothetical protein
MYQTIYDGFDDAEQGAVAVRSGRGTADQGVRREDGEPDEFVRRSFESLWGYLSPDA